MHDHSQPKTRRIHLIKCLMSAKCLPQTAISDFKFFFQFAEWVIWFIPQWLNCLIFSKLQVLAFILNLMHEIWANCLSMLRTHYVALCTFLFLKKEKQGQWPIIPLLKIFLFSFDISKYQFLKFYTSNTFVSLFLFALLPPYLPIMPLPPPLLTSLPLEPDMFSKYQ